MKRVLHLTWDGPGQSYFESLYSPLYRELSKHGIIVDTLQFCSAGKRDIERRVAVAQIRGVGYTGVRIGSSPRSIRKLLSLPRAVVALVSTASRNSPDVIIVRGPIPSVIFFFAKRLISTVEFVYESDGVTSEERADFAGWSRTGIRYRCLKSIESKALHDAALVTTRTEACSDFLRHRQKQQIQSSFVQVTNGRDCRIFRPLRNEEVIARRRLLALSESAPVLIYVGSLAEAKYNFSRVVRLFNLVSKVCPDAGIVVLTGFPDRAEEAFRAQESDMTNVRIITAAADQVPQIVGACDVGVSFCQPCLSTKFVVPIKVAEYLLCGVPVAFLKGVGDLDEQLDRNCSLGLDDLQDSSLEQVAIWLTDEVVTRRGRFCQYASQVGNDHFSLDRMKDQYLSFLRR